MAKVYCYYRPATESGFRFGPSMGGQLVDFGHFLIEVEKGGRRLAFDYWPEGQRSVVRTTLSDDRNLRHLYLSFFVSDAAADRMIAKIREYARQPPQYEFPFASTCVSRSNEILSLAGLGVDGALTPAGLWEGLIDQSVRGPAVVWRDRNDERITYPREFLPQRHGVPLPPPSDQAWMAGQARRWRQQVSQQQQMQRQQQALQQLLQRNHAASHALASRPRTAAPAGSHPAPEGFGQRLATPSERTCSGTQPGHPGPRPRRNAHRQYR